MWWYCDYNGSSTPSPSLRFSSDKKDQCAQPNCKSYDYAVTDIKPCLISLPIAGITYSILSRAAEIRSTATLHRLEKVTVPGVQTLHSCRADLQGFSTRAHVVFSVREKNEDEDEAEIVNRRLF